MHWFSLDYRGSQAMAVWFHTYNHNSWNSRRSLCPRQSIQCSQECIISVFSTSCNVYWTRKAAFNTADFVALLPNTECTVVLAFGQTKTERDGDCHQQYLHLVIQEDDCMFVSFSDYCLHTLKWFTKWCKSCSNFRWICHTDRCLWFVWIVRGSSQWYLMHVQWILFDVCPLGCIWCVSRLWGSSGLYLMCVQWGIFDVCPVGCIWCVSTGLYLMCVHWVVFDVCPLGCTCVSTGLYLCVHWVVLVGSTGLYLMCVHWVVLVCPLGCTCVSTGLYLLCVQTVWGSSRGVWYCHQQPAPSGVSEATATPVWQHPGAPWEPGPLWSCLPAAQPRQ